MLFKLKPSFVFDACLYSSFVDDPVPSTSLVLFNHFLLFVRYVYVWRKLILCLWQCFSKCFVDELLICFQWFIIWNVYFLHIQICQRFYDIFLFLTTFGQLIAVCNRLFPNWSPRIFYGFNFFIVDASFLRLYLLHSIKWI